MASYHTIKFESASGQVLWHGEQRRTLFNSSSPSTPMMDAGLVEVIEVNALLLESGDTLLLENGGRILLEQ